MLNKAKGSEVNFEVRDAHSQMKRKKLWRKGYESWERITGTNFPMNVSWQVLITMVILGLFN